MKRDRTRYDNSRSPVFVTTTITGHLHIFNESKLAIKVLQLLEEVRGKYEMKIYSYCLMYNHIHMILQSKKNGDLSKFMREWKSLTAKEILKFAKENSPELLKQFEKSAEKYHLSSQQKYHIWASRFDDLQLRTPEIVKIKFHYIHDNPVRKGLVENSSQYNYSSAGWYEGKGETIVSLSDIRTIMF